jgi:predicted transcriptional regulator of viral defense system
MVTQPQFVIFTSTTKRLRNRTIHGTEFRFVLVRREDAFGVTTHWVSKQESVKISDIERNVIDGLHLPTYCGGITEVAKGLWMRRDDVKAGKLIDYALRLGVGAVVRRLGYLLDLYQIAPPEELDRLRRSLNATYAVLNPMLPPEGAYVSEWRLRVNVAPEALGKFQSSSIKLGRCRDSASSTFCIVEIASSPSSTTWRFAARPDRFRTCRIT